MTIIDGRAIQFSYDTVDGPVTALRDVSISVQEGEFVAILGCNGSGKSTLARLFNALLPLQTGSLTVAGLDAGREENRWQLRRLCGMVFQNPDSQFVSSVLGEDVAFGPENAQVPREEIPGIVERALASVGLSGFQARAPYTLSGGQTQRAALAGVLAVEPRILIFDEATAMLDPEGRREVLEHMLRLKERGRTVVMITHYVEEAVLADSVWLMAEGRVTAHGSPREVLTDRALMTEAGLTPPFATGLWWALTDAGIVSDRSILTESELEDALCG